MMFLDQVVTGTTDNASWPMNVEGFGGIGLAFKPKLGACVVN
jgi:hypothetical protein